MPFSPGGGSCRRPPCAMRLLGWWQVLLWVLGPPVRGLEVAEENGHLWSEEQPVPPLQVGAVHMSEEEPAGGLMGEPQSEEEARAALGLDADGNHMLMLSVIPGEAEDKLSSESSSGTCRAGGQEDSRCNLRESLFSLDSAGASSPDREEEYYTEPEVAESEPAPAEDSNNTESLKSPKVNCEERNVTGLENFTLRILNISQVREYMHQLAKVIAYPQLIFYEGWSLSTRFGTVAVPNILLFQGAKPMARFNHTDRTLETLKIFIFNQTGIEAKKNVVVTQADQIGPLPSTLIKSVDWLLVFSLFFLISFVMYATIRTESIRWLIPGQEPEHAE
ncbi:hypothetical protein MC885_001944 [Smutsia gigantea]|nr:hypothetical protein MC885_001944 [Smutsia gigantea]